MYWVCVKLDAARHLQSTQQSAKSNLRGGPRADQTALRWGAGQDYQYTTITSCTRWPEKKCTRGNVPIGHLIVKF